MHHNNRSRTEILMQMKTMKIPKNILLLAATLILCVSCLSEKPYGVYSNQTFFQTESDAENGLMYAYVPINYIEYCQRFLFYLGDTTTDEYNDYGKGMESDALTWDISSNSEEVLYFFKSAYISLARTNTVIDNVLKMKNIPDQSRSRILGEAYFLRAFNHFMLVINFGSVPLRTKAVESVSETYEECAPLEDLYESIISDLKEAMGLLGYNKVQGRVDKAAAQALLGRVYLYLASFKESGRPEYAWVSDAEEMYAESAEYSSGLIYGQSTYSLCDNLDDIYDVTKQASCPEHVFITSMNREASGMEGTYSQLPCLWAIQLNDYIWIPEKLDGSSAKVIKMIDFTATWQVFRVDYRFRDSFPDGDLRKKLMVDTIYNEDGTVLASFAPSNINSTDPTLNKFFFPFCRKYTDPYSKNSRCSSNVYLIRMGEVYLNYAEAAGPTEKGYECVNAVRKRAAMPPLEEGLSKDEFREAVRLERTRELCFEGHALYDLRRLGRVDSIRNRPVKQAYAYYFPLPQRELDLNPQNL